MALSKTLWQTLVDLVSTGQDASDMFDTAFSNIDGAIDQIDTNVTDIIALKNPAKIPFDPQETPPEHLEGQMYYDPVKGTMRIQGPVAGITVAVGHGMHIHVENNSGALIEKGMAVRQDSVVAGKIQIVKAQADTFLHARMFGIAQADIADEKEGAVATFGEITDLDTSGLPAGVPLYLSDTVAGTYTSTAPDIISRVGGVTVSDESGTLFVSIVNNKNTPTVFGGMKGQSGTGVYSLTTTAQDITDYDTSDTVVMAVDKPNGTITLSNDGKHRIHFTSAISFASSSQTRSITIELYDVTGAEIHFPYIKNIPKDATEDSLSFDFPIDEVTGTVHKIRIKASTNMDITFESIVFDIQSISITA